ncbi:unnamed protein product [Trichogramma brassicae]|uniref:Uncharacterized protein n=1 Tax=Trichogramma brassicae TaxID=86971 RepID=A0A6H5IRZ2_9HYME|nr:unnamed protein product [Trichogramma brassicae]
MCTISSAKSSAVCTYLAEPNKTPRAGQHTKRSRVPRTTCETRETYQFPESSFKKVTARCRNRFQTQKCRGLASLSLGSAATAAERRCGAESLHTRMNFNILCSSVTSAKRCAAIHFITYALGAHSERKSYTKISKISCTLAFVFLRARDGNQWQILHASKLAWIKQKKKRNAPRIREHERSSSSGVPNRYNARVRQRVVCALPLSGISISGLYKAVWDATRRETARSTFSYLFDLRIIECKCCYKFSYLKSWQAAAKKKSQIKKKDKKQTRTNTHKRARIGQRTPSFSRVYSVTMLSTLILDVESRKCTRRLFSGHPFVPLHRGPSRLATRCQRGTRRREHLTNGRREIDPQRVGHRTFVQRSFIRARRLD